jgi:AraC-like DNA-binding protein
MLDYFYFLSDGVLLTLAIVLFFNPFNTNKKGVRYLALFFSLIFLSNFVDALFSKNIIQFLFQEEIIVFVSSFIPVCFYLAIHFFIHPKRNFFTTPKAFLFVFPLLLFLSYYEKSIYFIFIYVCNLLTITILSLYEFNLFSKKIIHFSSNVDAVSLLWLKRALLFTTLLACNEMLMVLDFEIFSNFNLFSILLNLICFLFIGYNSLRQAEIYPIEIHSSELQSGILVDLDASTSIDKPELLDIENDKEKIQNYFLIEKTFLQPELNIAKVANDLNTTVHKVSFTINKGFETNFNQFVNSFRIEEAKKLLKDKAFQNYTIEAISFEVGFNSKVSFNTTFKKATGVTPSEYRHS